MTIGNLIKDIRGGTKQEAFTKEIGISQPHLCNLERGKMQPGIKTLHLLSKKCGVSIEALITKYKLY